MELATQAPPESQLVGSKCLKCTESLLLFTTAYQRSVRWPWSYGPAHQPSQQGTLPRHPNPKHQPCCPPLLLPPLLLQTGQFIGARGDFVPEQICRRLALLQDQVPPMPPAQAREVIEDELGMPLEQAFEWIDLEEPLGSASISQVWWGWLGRSLRGRKEEL